MASFRQLAAMVVLAILFPGGASAPLAGDLEAARWVREARDAAASHRNAEAADAFERAIAESPSLRRELRLELAEQLTYSGRSHEAISLYREVLDEQSLPSDERRRAQLGLALALSWSDRHGPALREYEAVLRSNPEDLDVKRNIARVHSWQGRQRVAVRQLESLLEEHPGDVEATRQLARSLYWMGRPDRALEVLRPFLLANPTDQDAQRLYDEVVEAQRPESRADYRESHQSDDLRITALSFEQDVKLQDGQTVLGPIYQFYEYDPDQGSDILVHRPGFRARHRATDWLEWNGFFFVDVTRPRTGPEYAPFTYDTWITLFPNDLLRFDLGSSRKTFDNTTSLLRNITATYATASMDVYPDDLTQLSARFRWGKFSDGNEEAGWQLSGERRLWKLPHLYAGLRYRGMNFTKTRNNGYYEPDHYHAGELTLRSYGEIIEDFWYNAEFSGGVESAAGDRTRFIWSAGAGLSYWLTDTIEAAARYNYFSSSTGSTGGFDRGTGGLSLRKRW